MKRFGVLALLSVFLALPAFAQHGLNVSWVQSAGCGSTPCTITKNSVYQAPTSAGPFVSIYTSTAPITSYLVPLTSANQGTPACFVFTAWTTIESSQSTPAVCGTFPVQAASPVGVSVVPQ